MRFSSDRVNLRILLKKDKNIQNQILNQYIIIPTFTNKRCSTVAMKLQDKQRMDKI